MGNTTAAFLYENISRSLLLQGKGRAPLAVQINCWEDLLQLHPHTRCSSNDRHNLHPYATNYTLLTYLCQDSMRLRVTLAPTTQWKHQTNTLADLGVDCNDPRTLPRLRLPVADEGNHFCHFTHVLWFPNRKQKHTHTTSWLWVKNRVTPNWLALVNGNMD